MVDQAQVSAQAWSVCYNFLGVRATNLNICISNFCHSIEIKNKCRNQFWIQKFWGDFYFYLLLLFLFFGRGVWCGPWPQFFCTTLLSCDIRIFETLICLLSSYCLNLMWHHSTVSRSNAIKKFCHVSKCFHGFTEHN